MTLPDPFYSRAKELSASATGENRERIIDVAADVVRVLEDQPGLSLRQLRAAVRDVRGRCSDGDVDAAVVYLGSAVQRDPGPRSSHRHTLDPVLLPYDVQDRLERDR